MLTAILDTLREILAELVGLRRDLDKNEIERTNDAQSLVAHMQDIYREVSYLSQKVQERGR